MAFGLDPLELHGKQMVELLERAFAEAVTKTNLQVYRDDPMKWFQEVYPVICRDMGSYSARFAANRNALTDPAVLELLTDLASFVRCEFGVDASRQMSLWIKNQQRTRMKKP
ncbi:MAG: hypothetical protein HYX68_06755 [Planctomycetes bacterium]|nr:hypothetical protein [Planctomycetota bacterium]